MQVHFIGYTEQGVGWQTPRCQVCGYFHPKIEGVLDHFEAIHSHNHPWFYVMTEDPRLPGIQFHFLVDDPNMAKQLNGRPLVEPEEKKKDMKKPWQWDFS